MGAPATLPLAGRDQAWELREKWEPNQSVFPPVEVSRDCRVQLSKNMALKIQVALLAHGVEPAVDGEDLAIDETGPLPGHEHHEGCEVGIRITELAANGDQSRHHGVVGRQLRGVEGGAVI